MQRAAACMQRPCLCQRDSVFQSHPSASCRNLGREAQLRHTYIGVARTERPHAGNHPDNEQLGKRGHYHAAQCLFYGLDALRPWFGMARVPASHRTAYLSPAAFRRDNAQDIQCPAYPFVCTFLCSYSVCVAKGVLSRFIHADDEQGLYRQNCFL